MAKLPPIEKAVRIIPPLKKVGDPPPEWIRIIDREKWLQIAEFENEILQKELELQKQWLQGLKNITK
jgi:hypothetical protein